MHYHKYKNAGIIIICALILILPIYKINASPAPQEDTVSNQKYDVDFDNSKIYLGVPQNSNVAAYVDKNKIYFIVNGAIDKDFLKNPLINQRSDKNSALHVKKISKVYEANNLTVIEVDFYIVNNENAKFDVVKSGNKWIVKIEEIQVNEETEFFHIATKQDVRQNLLIDIEAKNQFSVMSFIHPKTGHEILFVPFNVPVNGLNNARKYIDVCVHQSFQGLVIEKKSDVVNITYGNKGIKIFTENVYTALDEALEDTATEAEYTKDATAYLVDTRGYIANGEYLMSLINVTRERAVNSHKEEDYADLIRVYLSNGLYYELLGVINLISRDLDFYYGVRPETIITKAIAEFMISNTIDARETLSKIDISNIPTVLRPEVRLWDSILNCDNPEVQSDPLRKSIDLIAQKSKNFLVGYNQDILFGMAMKLAYCSRSSGDVGLSNEALDNIAMDVDLKADKRLRLNYELAKNYVLNANYKQGIEMLDECIQQSKDMIQIKACSLEGVIAKHKFGSVEDKDYIEQLENITATWRDDAIELKALQSLADIYKAKTMMKEAVFTNDRIARYYKNTPEGVLAARTLTNILSDLLLEGYKGQDPFEALKLFYDFEEYIPLGGVGDEITGNIVDVLIDLDMVDKASVFLKHLIDNRVYGSKRELMINKLAELKLAELDPQGAIETILLSEKDIILADDCAKKRKILIARALGDLGSSDEALAFLGDELDEDLFEVKANIAWQGEKLDIFLRNVEPGTYKAVESGDKLSNKDVMNVIKQAVAYAMLDKYEELDELYLNAKEKVGDASVSALNVLNIIVGLVKSQEPMDAMQKGASLKKALEELWNSEELKVEALDGGGAAEKT